MKIVKAIAVVLALAVLVVGGFLAKVAIVGIPSYPTQKVELHVASTPERVQRGRKLATMLCAECHMNAATGRLSGEDMRIDEQFGKIYSYNITQDPVHGIGAWTDGEIAFLLRTGIARDGRYTPPWMAKLPHLSDEDLASIIAFLRSDDPMLAPTKVASIKSQPNFFAKFLSNVAFKPFDYPQKPIDMPKPTDQEAFGRYLTWNLDCWTCHSPDFSTVTPLDPPATPGFLSGGNPVMNAEGEAILSSNLTPDAETGIGKWTLDEFKRALREGVRPDGRAIRSPMNAYNQLTDEEVSGIFTYLRSVPAIKHEVARSAGKQPKANASAGEQAYYKYACYSCHGEAGKGNCDLTKAGSSYPSDEELIAFINEPASKAPGSRMPAWKNVIPEAEMKNLVAYVRQLSAK